MLSQGAELRSIGGATEEFRHTREELSESQSRLE